MMNSLQITMIHQGRVLRSIGTKSKVYLLRDKKQWTYERFDKTSDKNFNKTYAEYKQCELNEKVEKTGKALGNHVISL